MENYGFIRCAIANVPDGLSKPNVFAGHFVESLRLATKNNIRILVFPELSITGYTCQDLFINQELYNNSLSSLKTIVELSQFDTDTLFIVGCPIKNNDRLYNCAVVFRRGEILGIVPKQFLTSSEKRWFTEYDDFSVTSVNLFGNKIPFGNLIFSSSLGYSIGVEIGEDLYSPITPSSKLALAGANIIANLSASPELVSKDEYRKSLIQNQSIKTHSAYMYVSSSFNESTSDMVFGGSGYIYEDGKLLKEAKRFQMDFSLYIADIDIQNIENARLQDKIFSDSKKYLDTNFRTITFYQRNQTVSELKIKPERKIQKNPFVPISDTEKNKVCEEIINIQSTALARRLKAINCKSVVLGVSGGLDSTLALLVCYEAFEKLNYHESGIIGITMPGFGTSDRTYNNSKAISRELGITLKEISIKEACWQHFKDINHNLKIHDITYENSQARERTQILMDVANKYNAILVGTGDLSELVLGWCTYNGDHMSMYNVNGSIPKTLIKHLIRWFAANKLQDNSELKNIILSIIDTPISPELLPTSGKEIAQKTENTVGPYDLIDFFIYYLLGKHFNKDKIIYLASIAFEKKYTLEQIHNYYNRFITRFHNNQFKRNCLPDGPTVGNITVSPRGGLFIPSDI